MNEKKKEDKKISIEKNEVKVEKKSSYSKKKKIKRFLLKKMR